MQRSFKLATQAGESSLDYWGFAVHTAMALIVVVLFILTFSALEVFLPVAILGTLRHWF